MISETEIRVFFAEVYSDEMERTPHKLVINAFVEYIEKDFPQWLTDNYKSFMRDVHNEISTFQTCKTTLRGVGG